MYYSMYDATLLFGRICFAAYSPVYDWKRNNLTSEPAAADFLVSPRRIHCTIPGRADAIYSKQPNVI